MADIFRNYRARFPANRFPVRDTTRDDMNLAARLRWLRRPNPYRQAAPIGTPGSGGAGAPPGGGGGSKFIDPG